MWVFLGVLEQYKVSWPWLQTQLTFNVQPFLAQFSCDSSFAIFKKKIIWCFCDFILGFMAKIRQDRENELGMKSKHDMFQM